MEKYDVYSDIATRTEGDIYIGVVGPVRTGKSTFIGKFMDYFVLPNINNKLQKQIATDEMPQSADGKTIMTTQPKFIPANAVKVQFKSKMTANVRLVDCVGYVVEGATGHEEDGKSRLVKTPWSQEKMTFSKAAEIGTRKVITEYSTVGVLVTTDGSFSGIARENYIEAEEKTVNELKANGKPFIIILNTSNPKSESAITLADSLEEKYGVTVVCLSVLNMSSDDVSDIVEKILLEFPMNSVNFNLPEWIRALPSNSKIVEEIILTAKEGTKGVEKMKDYPVLSEIFGDSDKFNPVELGELKLGKGNAEYNVSAKDGLFYNVLSEECSEKIDSEYDLMSFVKSCADSRSKYLKIKDALYSAEESGYGIVLPSMEDMNLEEPVLVKNNGRYGVKLKASAPSLHIMKVDVSTEVSPTVGTEKQGEDLVNYLMKKFEDNPSSLWETDMFGKSLHDLVNEGLQGKVYAMPKDAQSKMRKTVTRIVNENKGGVICILL